MVHPLDSGFESGFQDRAVPREADLEIEDEERVPAEELLVVGAGEAVVVRHDWFVEAEVNREPEMGAGLVSALSIDQFIYGTWVLSM